ncbi:MULTISPECIES: hypothetical protein [Lentzea]|uniref:hypothetical protein n=1 Tax=Lentzea TaxID=165301 RepID=UPI0004C2EE3C|nr:hypothetical protein [Lentzea aerocolonigenes]MCP2242516.1 hypothetical protein [Lentzea aerocolonigenes]
MTSSPMLLYDPLQVWSQVFSNPTLAAALADVFSCIEINVMAGLLDEAGEPHASRRWLSRHLADCLTPERHLN